MAHKKHKTKYPLYRQWYKTIMSLSDDITTWTAQQKHYLMHISSPMGKVPIESFLSDQERVALISKCMRVLRLHSTRARNN